MIEYIKKHALKTILGILILLSIYSYGPFLLNLAGNQLTQALLQMEKLKLTSLVGGSLFLYIFLITWVIVLHIKLKRPNEYRCPHCGSYKYFLNESKPYELEPELAQLGMITLVYKCNKCGFTHNEHHTAIDKSGNPVMKD